jgi:hypothetical protein
MSTPAWLDNLAARLTFGPVPVSETGRPDLAVGHVLRGPDGSLLLVGDVNELFGVCDDCVYDRAFKAGHTEWQAAHLSQIAELLLWDPR